MYVCVCMYIISRYAGMSECKNEDIKFECACVCICACRFAQAAIFAAANDCMYVCITYMYVCIFVCVYLCMYVVCTYVCICVYICLCIFNVRNIYISMRVFVCVCIHVCAVVLAKNSAATNACIH